MVAQRAGITRKTLYRVERGDPAVALGVYARVLQALRLESDLGSIAADDVLGRKLQDAKPGAKVPVRRNVQPFARLLFERVNPEIRHDGRAHPTLRRSTPIWSILTNRRRWGRLHRQMIRGGDIFSFEYDPAWLRRPEAFSLDPDLALVAGRQYPAPGRENFGIFLDSSPDRWGRVLMQRRENMRARQEGRRSRTLTEWDFLLGVHDETRLGALRFQDPGTGKFVDSDDEFAAPPIASLREHSGGQSSVRKACR